MDVLMKPRNSKTHGSKVMVQKNLCPFFLETPCTSLRNDNRHSKHNFIRTTWLCVRANGTNGMIAM